MNAAPGHPARRIAGALLALGLGVALATAAVGQERIEGDRSWPRTVVLPTELVARGAPQRRTHRKPGMEADRATR